MRSTAARASARTAPDSPVLRAARSDAFSTSAVGFVLQVGDHLVDVASRLTQALVEPFVEPLLEDVLAIVQHTLALAQRRALLVEGTLLAFQFGSLGFERPGLRIESRQVGLQPLLVVTEKPARRWRSPVRACLAAAPFRWRGCGQALHNAVDRSGRSSADRRQKPPPPRLRSPMPHVFTESKCVVATTNAPR